MKRIPILFVALMFAAWSVEALAQPAPVNVMQDCWTTDLVPGQPQNPELELYAFTTDDGIDFIWKHKIMLTCTSYLFSIYGFDCIDGKPRPTTVRFAWQNQQIGAIDPDPSVPELLFLFTAPPGTIPPGRYDWAILAECNDTNGRIVGSPNKDGDIDDECGLNVGLRPAVGLFPVLFGPEPFEVFDPDPGGVPPGRGPGEEGTTRPWCFDVTPGLPDDAGKTDLRDVPYFQGAAARRHLVGKAADMRSGFDFMDHVLNPQPEVQPQQEQEDELPEGVQLLQNYPNPFRTETTISYTLAEPDGITLTIYDALGRIVKVLVDEQQGAGEHQVRFDGSELSAGVYFYYLEASKKKYMGKMVLQE